MINRKILVVDDDEKIVELVRVYLEKDGYRVLTSLDGLEALSLIREKRPDLVVLDLMLPGMDGLDVCRVVRAEGNKVPIIMLTARTTDEDMLTGLDLGADDYMTKPFSPKVLVARVRAALRRVLEEESTGPQEEVTYEDVKSEIDALQEAIAWMQMATKQLAAETSMSRIKVISCVEAALASFLSKELYELRKKLSISFKEKDNEDAGCG